MTPLQHLFLSSLAHTSSPNPRAPPSQIRSDILPCFLRETLATESQQKLCVKAPVRILNDRLPCGKALLKAKMTSKLPNCNRTKVKPANTNMQITESIISLAPRANKMNQILRCDWLPERARWSYLARSRVTRCPFARHLKLNP